MTGRLELPVWNFRLDRPGAAVSEVRLPHCAMPEPENVTEPWQGRAIYSTAFSWPAERASDILYLEITGAMQHCAVYLNDEYLYTHHGGYDRFLVRLDGRRDGANTIRLEMDNHASGDCPPGKPVAGLDFCYYSGLYREAAIVACPPLHISDPLAVAAPNGGGVFFRTLSSSPERAEVEISAHILHEVPIADRFELGKHYGESFPCQMRFTLRDMAGSIAAECTSKVFPLRMNCDHTFVERLTADRPALWSPAHPDLYTLTAELLVDGKVADMRTFRVGIRTVTATAAGGLCFNGERLFINGTNRHQDYPYVGNAVPANAQKRDAALLKAGGRNFLRLAHYPQHQAFLDACDELGIAVIACIPGWQHYALNDAFLNTLWRDVRELIRDYRNHPSVALWEVSLNETYPPNWINAELDRIAHAEFPGCLTCGDTYGLFEDWDVLYSRPGLATDKPVLVREYGDWCFGQNRSTSRQRRGGGEKAMLQQTWNYLWNGNRAGRGKGVIGIADWAAWDYNRGYYPETHRGGSGDIFRVPRYKYHFYRSQTAPEPMAFLAADWNRGPGSKDKVVVFSNCEEVALLVNGREVARRTPDAGPDTDYGGKPIDFLETAAGHPDASGGHPFDGGNAAYWPHPPFTFDDIAFEPGELTAVGFIDGKEAARTSVFTGGEAASLHLVIREDGVPAAANDIVFVEAHLLDAAGHPAHDAEAEVTLTVSAAEVLGPAKKMTEAGIASFPVRITHAGRVRLRAVSAGLASEEAVLTAR